MFHSDFSAPREASTLDKLATTRRLATENLAQIVNALPPGNPVEVIEPFGRKMVVVRDAGLLHQLSTCKSLDRGDSHRVVRKIFGQGTLFLQPSGPVHSLKKTELKSRLGKHDVTAQVPGIAAAASAAVDGMLAHGDEPIDMNAHVLRYLFGVAGRALSGGPIELPIHIGRFQTAIGAIIKTASSTLTLALASVCDALGSLCSSSAQWAGRGLLDIGRELLVAGAARPDDNLARAMLLRHGIDPATVDRRTVFPEPLLYDMSMMFAAAIITTSNLVMAVVNHYCRKPEELRALRALMQADFPQGVGQVQDLLNNPTLQKLVPVMLQNSPVGLVVRDVVSAHTFTDAAGVAYAVRPGDAVVFDLAGIQRQLAERQAARLAAAPVGSPLLDFLDARNNDVTVTFFDGGFQCPGRFLFLTDAALLLVETLSRIEAQWLAPDKPLERGLVDRLGGSPMMRVCPVRQEVHDRLHDQLHGMLHRAAPAQVCPVSAGGARHQVEPLAHRLHVSVSTHANPLQR